MQWVKQIFGSFIEWTIEVRFNTDISTSVRLWTWRHHDPVDGSPRDYSCVLTTYHHQRLHDETESDEIEGLPVNEPERLKAAQEQAIVWARHQNQKAGGEVIGHEQAYLIALGDQYGAPVS